MLTRMHSCISAAHAPMHSALHNTAIRWRAHLLRLRALLDLTQSRLASRRAHLGLLVALRLDELERRADDRLGRRLRHLARLLFGVVLERALLVHLDRA